MKETLWQRLSQGVGRFRCQPDWARFVGPNWTDRIMTVAVTDRFHSKQGRSTGRWILEAQGERLAVYLKRHYRLSWWRGLVAALWPDRGWSPAFKEWRRLEWARSQGMPVPDTVAAGEYIGPWCRLQSFLAIQELADMLPLHEAIPAAAGHLDAANFQRWKRGLIAEVARLSRELHDRRYFHKDFYLCHFYIPRSFVYSMPAWHGQVYLIDLHRLGYHPWTWRLRQTKDLAQLLFSSEVAGITPRDRLRFWRTYLGPDVRNRWMGLLRYGILLKWGRYRRHDKKRGQRAALSGRDR